MVHGRLGFEHLPTIRNGGLFPAMLARCLHVYFLGAFSQKHSLEHLVCEML